MRVLILGVSGMLGNAMLRVLARSADLEVQGTVRSPEVRRFFEVDLAQRIIPGIDIENHDTLVRLFAETRPQVVVNCVGLIKQHKEADDPLLALPLNAMLPHRLAKLCELAGARLIQIGTDCVFSGAKGSYRESDPCDAIDLYGQSKYLGEVAYTHSITLRTSLIGHELASHYALVDWFLAQEGPVKGYQRAIFSGLPTVEFAHLLRDVILPRPALSGIYHVAAEPISKHDLLKLVAEAYGKAIDIVPDDSVVIDRSLNAERFRTATGYVAPAWPELVRRMHEFK